MAAGTFLRGPDRISIASRTASEPCARGTSPCARRADRRLFPSALTICHSPLARERLPWRGNRRPCAKTTSPSAGRAFFVQKASVRQPRTTPPCAGMGVPALGSMIPAQRQRSVRRGQSPLHKDGCPPVHVWQTVTRRRSPLCKNDFPLRRDGRPCAWFDEPCAETELRAQR